MVGVGVTVFVEVAVGVIVTVGVRVTVGVFVDGMDVGVSVITGTRKFSDVQALRVSSTRIMKNKIFCLLNNKVSFNSRIFFLSNL